MAKTNVLQEAIADAKIIRETALRNAKSALEEALTPKFKRMISNKLNENEELDEEFDFSNDSNPTDRNSHSGTRSSFDFNNNDLDEELSSILAELEDDELNEAEDEDSKEKKDDSKDSKEDKKEPKKSTPKKDDSKKEPKDSDDEKLSSLSVSEFTDLIKDIVSQEMNATEDDGLGGDEFDAMGGDDLGGDEFGTDDMGMGADDMGTPDMGADEFGAEGTDFGTEDPNKDDINIEELMSELDEMYNGKKLQERKKQNVVDNKYKAKLNEAVKVINILRREINEVNLLNAKLLYVNKIFKAKNLNESQKLKVISSFDKAVNVKEAKLIFESLNSALSNNSNNKRTIVKENLGFASKPAGVAPKRQILEVDNQFSRMQILAGITK